MKDDERPTGDWNKAIKNIDIFDLGYKCGFRNAKYTYMKFRKINKDGDHGKWEEMTTADLTHEFKSTNALYDMKELTEQANSKQGLHTNWLLARGWLANGRIYTKGEDAIKFDGTYWWLNGERL